MKFMVLFKDDPKVIEFADQHAGFKFGHGANLVGWRQFIHTPYDKSLPKTTGIAYYCKGSIFSYLWHKIKLKTTVKKGWFSKNVMS